MVQFKREVLQEGGKEIILKDMEDLALKGLEDKDCAASINFIEVSQKRNGVKQKDFKALRKTFGYPVILNLFETNVYPSGCQ